LPRRTAILPQQQQIEAECSKLSEEAKEWEKQIEELTGEAVLGRA
jgi:hypothetical protein